MQEFGVAVTAVHDELDAISVAFDPTHLLTDIDTLTIPALMGFGLNQTAATMWVARIDKWVAIRTALAAVVAETNIP
jgi:hypothetical protein